MIIQNVRDEIIANATLNAVFGSRVFPRKPLEEQTEPYITMLASKIQNQVTDFHRIRFIMFDADSEQLETMANTFEDLFFNKTVVGGNANIYQATQLSRQESDAQLKNGMYWTILNYQFKEVRS